jgi:hypothetical protein
MFETGLISGAEHDSNFLSHGEAGYIFYFVSVTIGLKLVQEGEPLLKLIGKIIFQDSPTYEKKP